MLVYTYQNKVKVKELQESGVLKVTKKDIPNLFFYFDNELREINHLDYIKLAYDFMMREMNRKLGKPDDDIIYPVWFWYRSRGKRRDVKLQDEEEKESADRQQEVMYRIDFEIDKKNCLLSDFDLWIQLLNGLWVNVSNEDNEKDDYKYLINNHNINDKTYQETLDRVNRQVFNYNHKVENDWYFSTKENNVQGCTYKITIDQVKKIKRL